MISSAGLKIWYLLQILVDLNVAAAKILQDTHPEKIIIKQAVEGIRSFMSAQSTYNNMYLPQIPLS